MGTGSDLAADALAAGWPGRTIPLYRRLPPPLDDVTLVALHVRAGLVGVLASVRGADVPMVSLPERTIVVTDAAGNEAVNLPGRGLFGHLASLTLGPAVEPDRGPLVLDVGDGDPLVIDATVLVGGAEVPELEVVLSALEGVDAVQWVLRVGRLLVDQLTGRRFPVLVRALIGTARTMEVALASPHPFGHLPPGRTGVEVLADGRPLDRTRGGAGWDADTYVQHWRVELPPPGTRALTFRWEGDEVSVPFAGALAR